MFIRITMANRVMRVPFVHVTKSGLLNNHLPTSTCSRSYWMTFYFKIIFTFFSCLTWYISNSWMTYLTYQAMSNLIKEWPKNTIISILVHFLEIFVWKFLEKRWLYIWVDLMPRVTSLEQLSIAEVIGE